MSKESKKSGVGFMELLLLLFIGLKLAGFIEWSWWWVLSPIWLPLGVAGTAYLIVVLVVAVEYFVLGKR